jgi:hypothetical protein
MNTFWLKVAGVGVVALVVLVVAGKFFSGDDRSEPADKFAADTKPKTIYDKFEEDDARMDAPIQAKEQVSNQESGAQPARELRTLSPDQQVAAEQIWEWIKAEKKMSRLPIFTYKKFVDHCRDLIKRFPGTEFEIKARRELAEVPEHKWKQYNITKEETDTGNYQ